jgi:SAM-dependent methyltransferase
VPCIKTGQRPETGALPLRSGNAGQGLAAKTRPGAGTACVRVLVTHPASGADIRPLRAARHQTEPIWMKLPADDAFRATLEADPALVRFSSLGAIIDGYEEAVEAFHAHFEPHFARNNIENALYHKQRYIFILQQEYTGRVLDVGNDKPFLTFVTISYDIPRSPFELHRVDIEADPLPFPDGHFESAILAEVIEHLWRDPALICAELNRVLKPGGTILLTTPNPCEKHALVSVLWQSNPNQRGKIYRMLESGHLHMWTVAELQVLLEAHGFDAEDAETHDFWGYTAPDPLLDELIAKVAPYPELMGECTVIVARKLHDQPVVIYPQELFPDGGPVAFEGAIRSYASRQAPG